MSRFPRSANNSILVGILAWCVGICNTQLTDIQRSFLKPECFSLTMIDIGPPEEEVTGDRLTSFYPTYLMQPQNAFMLLEARPTANSTTKNISVNSKDSVLIIVDVQNDFFSHDAPLKVPGGDRIVDGIIKILPKFSKVVVTMDWHPPMHISFASRYVELNLKTDKNQLVQQGQKYEFTLSSRNQRLSGSWSPPNQSEASSSVPLSSVEATANRNSRTEQFSGANTQNSPAASLPEKLSVITWPRHCVQHTVGAEVHKGLRLAIDKHFNNQEKGGPPKENLIKVYKGVYENHESFSGFVEYVDTIDDGTGLKDENGNKITLVNLKDNLKIRDGLDKDGKSILIGPPEIFICGLAAEYCVKSTALDAKMKFPESDVYIITDAVGYFTNFFGPKRYAAFKELQDAGVLFTVVSAII